MGMAGQRSEGAIRLSWCHMTPQPDWPRFVQAIRQLRAQVAAGS
jgi:cysteine sulfinate desulfinase/cysteine desulfurase-like protein